MRSFILAAALAATWLSACDTDPKTGEPIEAAVDTGKWAEDGDITILGEKGPSLGEEYAGLYKIGKGSIGWAHMPGSWNGSIGCISCGAAPGSTVSANYLNCVFTLTVDDQGCVCIGDDPGESTMGLQLGCWCHGQVATYPSGGACADSNLPVGGI